MQRQWASFGELLSAFRARRKLTQTALAATLGTHRNTISRWERGEVLPDARGSVLELARLLHLDERDTRQLLEASLTALAPHWAVPLPRNPYFIGREVILGQVHAALTVGQGVNVTPSCALTGLGGMGKTQIAIEYAYRYAFTYRAIFWMQAENDERLLASYLHIAEVLQLPERQEQEQHHVVAAVQRWLASHQDWLLIGDNVDNVDVLQSLLSVGGQGAILLTTQQQALGTGAAVSITLPPLASEEGIMLLLRRGKVAGPLLAPESVTTLSEYSSSDYHAAQQLVKLLGALPLALDQAGAYIEEAGCGVADYLERFEQQRARLLARRGNVTSNHPHSVLTTILLACQRVTDAQPNALYLLRLCTFLHPDAIPEELFLTATSEPTDPLPPPVADRYHFDTLLTLLRSLSLVQRQSGTHTLSLHRLVQTVLWEAMNEDERHHGLRHIVRLLNACYPEVTPTVWEQCERLVPHVLACLPLVAAETSPYLAALLRKTATYLAERARYQQAETLFAQALQIQEQLLGEAHPDIADMLNSLGRLYYAEGRFDEAENAFLRTLHIREQALGLAHPAIALTLNSLSAIYFVQGRYAEVEVVCQRSVAIREQALGPHHFDVTLPLHNLAMIAHKQGRYGEAESRYLRILHIWEDELGNESIKLGPVLNNLAELYREQSRFAEAAPIYQRSLRIREIALGLDHPKVAFSLVNLGDLYREEGKYAEAEPLYCRALHICSQTLEPNHPDTAATLTSLAELYRQQGKHQAAEPIYHQAISIYEHALGVAHPEYANALRGLANLNRDQGHWEDATNLYKRTLAIWEQSLGQQHPEIAETFHNLAILQQEQGNLQQSMSLYQQALTIRQHTFGDTHPKTIASRTGYRLMRDAIASPKP